LSLITIIIPDEKTLRPPGPNNPIRLNRSVRKEGKHRTETRENRDSASRDKRFAGYRFALNNPFFPEGPAAGLSPDCHRTGTAGTQNRRDEQPSGFAFKTGANLNYLAKARNTVIFFTEYSNGLIPFQMNIL
jgi:hypothetical protein